jgi:sugar phosphate permease
VLLVTAAVFINFIDRGNLATAAPLMQDQLHLSASQLGFLLSAFYYGYVALMPSVGWLAERYGAKLVLGVGVAVWSIATLTTGFATSFATLVMLRVLLGVGESAAFPCASKVLATSVEVQYLGVANGVFSFGYLIGPAVHRPRFRRRTNRNRHSDRFCASALFGVRRSGTLLRTTVSTSFFPGCRFTWSRLGECRWGRWP